MDVHNIIKQKQVNVGTVTDIYKGKFKLHIR
jgi:hypothetical protein